MLVAVFLVSVPPTARHVALVVQFQISRVFWVVEFLALAYGVALVSERLGSRRMRAIAVGVVALAAARGPYAWEHQAETLLALYDGLRLPAEPPAR